MGHPLPQGFGGVVRSTRKRSHFGRGRLHRHRSLSFGCFINDFTFLCRESIRASVDPSFPVPTLRSASPGLYYGVVYSRRTRGETSEWNGTTGIPGVPSPSVVSSFFSLSLSGTSDQT